MRGQLQGTIIPLLIILFINLAVEATSRLPIDSNAEEFNPARYDLCEHDWTIEHISSVEKILHHFESSPNIACRQLWLQPLRDLQQVLAVSQEDACDLRAANEIEKFHWNYIVGTLSWSWRKASKTPIAEPLKVFFMQFAEQTLDRCKSKAGDRLEEAVARRGNEASQSASFDESLSKMINALSVALVPESKINSYDSFFFVFNALDTMDRKRGSELPEEIPDPETGEVVYFAAKVKDASKPYAIQRKCQQDLRPVYANTIWPMMKLIDLGYGKREENFVERSDLFANWYAMAQLCQLILPIKFYISPALRQDQISIVSEKEKEQLESPYVRASLPANIEVEPTRPEDKICVAHNNELVKQVKTNFKSRASAYRRTLKNVLAAVRSQVTSRIKSIFSFGRNKQDELTIKKDEELAKTIREAEEGLSDEEHEESSSFWRSGRRKREIFAWENERYQEPKKEPPHAPQVPRPEGHLDGPQGHLDGREGHSDGPQGHLDEPQVHAVDLDGHPVDLDGLPVDHDGLPVETTPNPLSEKEQQELELRRKEAEKRRNRRARWALFGIIAILFALAVCISFTVTTVLLMPG